jgi:hypothetical protein
VDLRESGWRGVDWIRLAQDRDQWRGVVNRVTNLQGFCVTELVSYLGNFSSVPSQILEVILV